jgi:hypothetical protein
MAPSTSINDNMLLKLPAELRNRIYELALLEDGDIDTHTWCTPVDIPTLAISLSGLRPQKFYNSEPSLLLTCRQIRREGLPIFYGVNTFSVGILGCSEWLRGLTAEKRDMVKRVRVVCCVDIYDLSEEDIKAEFKNSAPIGLLERLRNVVQGKDVAFRDEMFVFTFFGHGVLLQQWRGDEAGRWVRERLD